MAAALLGEETLLAAAPLAGELIAESADIIHGLHRGERLSSSAGACLHAASLLVGTTSCPAGHRMQRLCTTEFSSGAFCQLSADIGGPPPKRMRIMCTSGRMKGMRTCAGASHGASAFLCSTNAQGRAALYCKNSFQDEAVMDHFEEECKLGMRLLGSKLTACCSVLCSCFEGTF